MNNKILLFGLVIICFFTWGCNSKSISSGQKSNNLEQNSELPTNSNANDSFNESQISYKLYTNDRYGFSIECPNTFVVKVVPDNDDGRIFSSLDGDVELTVSGINNVLEETAQFYYQQILKEHSNVAYKAQTGNWLIVSWVEGNEIIYEKMVVGSGSINTLLIKYPLSQKKTYDFVISHLNASFKTPFIDESH